MRSLPAVNHPTPRRAVSADSVRERLRPVQDAWLPLTLSAVLLTGVLTMAGLWLTHVGEDGAIARWDLDVEQRLVEARTDLLDSLTKIGTFLSETVPVLVVLLIAIALAWRSSSVVAAPAFLAVAVGGEKLIYLITSLLVGRERPPVPTVGDTYATSSFPSGHVASAITLYGAIALLVGLERPPAVRRSLLTLVALAAGVVAFCRMYRGFHYPTDVLAGVVLGVVWLVVTYRYVLLQADRSDRSRRT
jgi:membrane-associated phospholipid phosphatase